MACVTNMTCIEIQTNFWKIWESTFLNFSAQNILRFIKNNNIVS